MGTPRVLIRSEARSVEDGTFEAYAQGVAAMKARPADDPTSWAYQAAIHGRDGESGALYNQCQHGSWYFVVWHRLYLYYFERIVRAAVVEAGGSEDWALPYWNYGIDQAHASIPEPFRDPIGTGGGNPLYVEERAPGINTGGAIPGPIGSDATALACPEFVGDTQLGGEPSSPRQFWNQAGELEQSPHNAIHGIVGGPPPGWMSSVFTAAADPIFWLHHCNIDRIWAQWSVDHQNPTDSSWLDQEFEFFDADGSRVGKTCREALDTVADLGYTYDVLPVPPPEPEPTQPTEEPEPTPDEGAPVAYESVAAGATDPKVMGASEQTLTLKGSPEAVPVAIENRAQEEVFEATRQTDPRRLYLNIEDIEGEQNPGTVYGVYLNLPEDPDEETLARHYAGNISFFGIEQSRNPAGDEHGHNLRYTLDVGELLRSLGGGERFEEEEVQVSFRPLSLLPPEGASEEAFRATEAPAEEPPVRIGRVSLSVG